MKRKLLGIISVDFNTAGQLLIIYSAFVKYGGTSIYHFSRGWRNKTMNVGK
jgi:hypothetical protein